MSEAIIKGMLNSKLVKAAEIAVLDVVEERCQYLAAAYKVSASVKAESVLQNATTVFLAVKPQMVAAALSAKLLKIFPRNAVVVSIVAGLALAEMEKILPKRSLIRVMPNTPLAVGAGMTVLSRGADVPETAVAEVKSIFAACGEVLELPESMLDAVTGLSGSGPGYAFVLIDAMADAGVMAGLPRATAIKLAAQTFAGAGRMVLETGKHPAELRDQVTSPGGTTIAGIAAMEKAGVRSGMIEAVLASAEKSRNLGK